MGQTGSFVYGVEADIESGGGATTIAGLGSADVGASATVRGKAGIALGQWLPYLTAGIALAKPELRLDGVGSTDDWRTGFAYGAGLAWRATPNLSLKGEVLRVDYGDIGIGATRIHLDETRVRAGITWHFN
jgi:opacity protein-like surface antigen